MQLCPYQYPDSFMSGKSIILLSKCNSHADLTFQTGEVKDLMTTFIQIKYAF